MRPSGPALPWIEASLSIYHLPNGLRLSPKTKKNRINLFILQGESYGWGNWRNLPYFLVPCNTGQLWNSGLIRDHGVLGYYGLARSTFRTRKLDRSLETSYLKTLLLLLESKCLNHRWLSVGPHGLLAGHGTLACAWHYGWCYWDPIYVTIWAMLLSIALNVVKLPLFLERGFSLKVATATNWLS